MRHRRMMIVAAALVLVVLSARHPTADITVMTHEAGDPQPRRVQAAVDLGLIGVKLLVTWSAHQLR